MGNVCSLLLDCLHWHRGYSAVPNIAEGYSALHTAELVASGAHSRKKLRGKQESYSESVLQDGGNKDENAAYNIGLPREFSKLYSLGRLLGVGTTSKVYQIFHTKRKQTSLNKTEFACKIIDKRKLTLGMEQDDIDSLLKQLRKEVDILRRINHPHIVAYHDFMESKSLLFIITEYLPGGELFDYILNNGPIAEPQACRALYGIFSAVSYLHERGVIHRDIKAENVIFFEKVNGDLSLKLIDFGFSTILKHDLTGSFLGTGGYIAPEIRQNRQYSMSVDNWALGVLIYCSLSAKLPFTVSVESLPADRINCQDAFKLRFPKRAWKHITPACKDIISKLLNTDPLERLTAREALLHPWFRSHNNNLANKNNSNRARSTSRSYSKAIPLSVQRSLSGEGISIFTASTQVADEPPTNRDHLLPRRRFDLSTSMKERRVDIPELVYVVKPRHDELPKLNNNQLRPVQSLLQLERKRLSPRRPNVDSPPDTGRKTDTSSISGDGELHSARISDHNSSMLTVTTSEGYSIGLALLPPDFSNHSNEQSSSGSQSQALIFPGMVSSSLKIIDQDFLQSRLVQENNKLPSLIAAKAVSRGGSEQRPPASPNDMNCSKTTPASQMASSFVFEETHHHQAGDLFYSTYIPLLR